MNNYHVATAAEAITAAQFARIDYEVAVQYGANQPEYDLVVVQGGRMLKVSVKGSQTGSWPVCGKYIEAGTGDYQGAITRWLSEHKSGTVYSYVQFKNVLPNAMPRMYLASPAEVAALLRDGAGGRGDGKLYEYKVWGPNAVAAGLIDRIPDTWLFSRERVDGLFDSMGSSRT